MTPHLALVISSLSSGGAERVLSELANHFVQSGYRISLIILASPNDKPFYLLDPRVALIPLNPQTRDTASLGHRLFDVLNRIVCLRKTLKKVAPDVALSFVETMNLTTLLATIGLKIPVVVSERTHPSFHHIPWLYAGLRKALYPHAKSVVVQTNSAAQYFKTLSNLRVIPNAVPTPLKRVETSQKVQAIVSLGRLCPNKDFETLIRAFHQLDALSDRTLTIYGEGPDRPRLETLIETLNLKDKVSLPGLTSNVEDALANADLFVFPSRYEGFPNALCEAMAAGLPVIASDCSGNVDVVQDGLNGRLFPMGDAGALTKLMDELINDHAQRQRLSKEALKLSDQFSPKKVYALWEEVLIK